jgi:anthranilate phosphoribosyltransferase
MNLRDTLERLLDGKDLAELEATELVVALTDAAMAPAMAGALLAALRAKGLAADEVRGFAKGMRQLARRPTLPDGPPGVDIVGTGGDASHSFNISTGASLLSAALGVRVIKHGNRSISSRSGSADLLECLGCRCRSTSAARASASQATGFTFLFAPHYHPAMKEIAPVRRALGVRTVFNLLGPLTNPAEPPFGLIGAYSRDAARLMAETLSGMPIERVFVVHGEPGWDEPTPCGPFELYDVRPGRIDRSERDPAHHGLARCTPQTLAGGDAAHNAASMRAVFAGEDRGPHRDALVLNAALVLELTGTVRDAADAIRAAADAIDRGDALRLVERSRGSARPCGKLVMGLLSDMAWSSAQRVAAARAVLADETCASAAPPCRAGAAALRCARFRPDRGAQAALTVARRPVGTNVRPGRSSA